MVHLPTLEFLAGTIIPTTRKIQIRNYTLLGIVTPLAPLVIDKREYYIYNMATSILHYHLAYLITPSKTSKFVFCDEVHE